MTVVGEPGTKAPLSLEELQAATGMRTGRKHVLSILVENKSGVLTRILYLGDIAHCFVASDGVEICAHAEPGAGFREGQTVFWRVEPEHCFLAMG